MKPMKRLPLSVLLLVICLAVQAPAQDHPPHEAPPAFEKIPGTDGGPPDSESLPDQAEPFDRQQVDDNAPDPFDPDYMATRLVQIQVEFIEIPHIAATKLLFGTRPKTSDATPLRTKLQELLEKNEAKLLDTQLVVAKSGQKATAESIAEFIYPTEYEAAGPPAPPRQASDQKPAPPKEQERPFDPVKLIPTAFDTRNVGSTLEVEPSLADDGKTVDLRLVPELIWCSGNTVWQETKDALGNVTKVEMPDFYSLRPNTQITCIGGQYTLLSLLSPRNSKGEMDPERKVMVFVKCDVLSVR